MLNDPEKLLLPLVKGQHFTIMWFNHGKVGDPKKFFDSLDPIPQAILHARIADHAANGVLAPSRGHEEKWTSPASSICDLVLYKYKGNTTIRIYGVIDRSFTVPLVVIIYGYKDLKKQKNKRQKASAESRAKDYKKYRDDNN